MDISEDLIQACVALDRYYIPTRYPNAWSEGSPEDYYTRRDAEEAIRLASLLVEWALELWRKLSRRG